MGSDGAAGPQAPRQCSLSHIVPSQSRFSWFRGTTVPENWDSSEPGLWGNGSSANGDTAEQARYLAHRNSTPLVTRWNKHSRSEWKQLLDCRSRTGRGLITTHPDYRNSWFLAWCGPSHLDWTSPDGALTNDWQGQCWCTIHRQNAVMRTPDHSD